MRKKERIKFLFVVPGIAWVLVFTIFPLLYSLRLSFFHARLTGPQFFIWFQNYGQAFGDYRFWAVLQTTVFFVVFDVESIYIFGWAIAWRELGWTGYVEVLVFIGILLAALVYLWRLGALDWGTAARLKRENR